MRDIYTAAVQPRTQIRHSINKVSKQVAKLTGQSISSLFLLRPQDAVKQSTEVVTLQLLPV